MPETEGSKQQQKIVWIRVSDRANGPDSKNGNNDLEKLVTQINKEMERRKIWKKGNKEGPLVKILWTEVLWNQK